MSSAFNSPENKKLLYELSLDLVKNRYNFAKLGTSTVQHVQQQLSAFLDEQHTLIYKNRFNYMDGGVKAMNKDMLRGANDFLYHLYKKYKSKSVSTSSIIPPESQMQTQSELKMVYERPTLKANEDTQMYKQERQTNLEQVMQEKQNDLQSYFSKPSKEIDFADKEDTQMKPEELEALLKRRQQEDSSLYVQHPRLSDQNDLSSNTLVKQNNKPKNETKDGLELKTEPEPRKVSFGTVSIRPFNDNEPSENVKSNQPNHNINSNPKTPTASNLLSRLKSQTVSEHSVYISKPHTFIKRLCLVISTTNISHHFLRLRGERTTQSPTQQQSILIQTILENLPVELTSSQKIQFKDFLKQHHKTIWRWWVFLEDIKRQGTTKQTNWWFDYFDIDNPYLDDFPRELREWLSQPIKSHK